MKKVAKVDFEVENGPRRAGDSEHLIAATKRIREMLGWQPRFDDLPTILSHALAWERKLASGRCFELTTTG
jgi:UDP-glucose 4-epimerase